jgi:hypothetical protein
MWHAVPGLGVELDKPVIAATSGWVVGGAFVLVQMADMCVASETTRFIYPEGKIGTTAGGISSVMARMPHKIADGVSAGSARKCRRNVPARSASSTRSPEGTACRARPGDGGKDRRQSAAGRSCAEEAGPRRHAEGDRWKAVAEVRRLLDVIRDSEDLRKASRPSRRSAKPKFNGQVADSICARTPGRAIVFAHVCGAQLLSERVSAAYTSRRKM